MRAQNEPPETVVRRNTLKQGEVAGEPDPEIPNALRVDHVDERALAEGLIWPQSRGSQLAGLCVDAREGERVLDLCAAPGGKATQLAERAAEVVAVEKHPGRARELEANCRRLGAANVRVVTADALELPGDLARLRPRARRRAVLGARRARLAARPALAREPLPELQRDLLRVAAERVKPGGTIVYSVCTLNAEENEAIVDASGLEVESLGRRSGRSSRHPRRPEFLLTRPDRDRTSGFFIARLQARLLVGVDHARELARLDPDDRGGAVALRGRLLAARRADRGAAPGRGARVPLRRRRRPLRPADHDGADRAPVDLADRPRGGRRARLPPDDRDAGAPLRAVPRGGRRQRHRPLRGLPGSAKRRRPRARAGARGRTWPSTRRRLRRRPRRRRSGPGWTSSSA